MIEDTPDRNSLLGRFARPKEGFDVFKIEVEDGRGIWTDVRGANGAVLLFEREDEARAKLAELFPVLVQMEKYAGGKRTRVIRILEDDDDWPKKTPPGSSGAA
jgi:hypothetical protein